MVCGSLPGGWGQGVGSRGVGGQRPADGSAGGFRIKQLKGQIQYVRRKSDTYRKEARPMSIQIHTLYSEFADIFCARAGWCLTEHLDGARVRR